MWGSRHGECTALAWYYLAIVDIKIELRPQLLRISWCDGKAPISSPANT